MNPQSLLKKKEGIGCDKVFHHCVSVYIQRVDGRGICLLCGQRDKGEIHIMLLYYVWMGRACVFGWWCWPMVQAGWDWWKAIGLGSGCGVGDLNETSCASLILMVALCFTPES